MTMVQAKTHFSLRFWPRQKLLALIALLTIALSATGCDMSGVTPKSAAGNNSGTRVEKLKTVLTAEDARDIAQPASNTPGLTVDTSAAQVGVGQGFDTQSKGLIAKRLFEEETGNEDERFARLEAAVQNLRDDFDKVTPSINRLMAIEGEIQTLVDQLNVLVENDNAPSDVPIPPIPAELVEEEPLPAQTPAVLPPIALKIEPPPAPTVPQTPAPSVSGAASLVAARAADHDKKTRVVFEISRDIPFTVDVDPEQILLANFKNGSAQKISNAGIKSSLVKSIDVTPQNGGGMIVAMPLSRPTKIIGKGTLKPDANNKNYRVYIDLAR